MTKVVTQIRCGNMPCDILPPSPCTRRRYVHPPASFLRTPPLRPPPLRHPCTRRRYVHPPGVIPAQAAVSPPPPSSLHTPPLRPPPASFLHTPPSRPSSGVIPAKAGILTRISFYKGRAATNNYAAISSRHISYGKCDGLCVLKSLVWIRAICKPKRP
ncbi:MAG: hypothetical protein BWY07_01939 [Candidatus Hydrogenedentes bacterium ADurb.Bin170]|nr:MAG: hypothetical protein BWY07_01939 [Candidatus Hydrogenedentes bacterium ADurb.Bin170]